MLHLKHFGLVDNGQKAITFSEWVTLAQDRAGWLKLVTKVTLGNPVATLGLRLWRSGGFWLGAPKRRSNGAPSSTQKQTTQKGLKAGPKFISST
jgi:hypothetical protein